VAAPAAVEPLSHFDPSFLRQRYDQISRLEEELAAEVTSL
jgi:hypothetical protein